MCVLGRGVCVMDGWRLVPEKSNLNTLRWDKEGKDPVFWDRTCPRDEQEEPPLVVLRQPLLPRLPPLPPTLEPCRESPGPGLAQARRAAPLPPRPPATPSCPTSKL